MAIDGEAVKDLFYRIGESPIPETVDLDLPSAINNCCNDFYLKVFAKTSGGDEYTDDKSGFIWWFSSAVSAVVLTLYKDGSVVETLDNNDFGTFYEYGFFVNDDEQSFIGYQLNWVDVLNEHGPGKYWVRCTPSSDIDGLVDGYLDSLTYCLEVYTAESANGTVRLEYYLNGVMGLSIDDYKTVDFGELNWYNALRLPGWFFGSPKSTYEQSDVDMNSGQRLWVTNTQEPEYKLKLKPLPQIVHDILRTDFMQADQRLITDYNSMNALKVVRKEVKPNSEYAPKWENREMVNRVAPVELKFLQEYNNLRKLRS